MTYNLDPFRSKIQYNETRKKSFEKYTYNYRVGKVPLKVNSARAKFIKNIPPLSPELDIARMIDEAEHVYKVKSPPPIHHQFLEDIRNSDKRALRVRCGQPLNRVFADKPVKYAMQPQPKNNILTEQESIRPIREYIVPQLENSVGFYNSRPTATMSDGDSAVNKLKGIIFDINEQDRKMHNKVLGDINRRNERRERSIRLKYNTYIKHGMKAAEKEVKRDAALSSLKKQRPEPWWPEFIETFDFDALTKEEKAIIHELVNSRLDDVGIIAFMRVCEQEMWSPFVWKRILKKANQIGHFMNPIRLGTLISTTNSCDMNEFTTLTNIALEIDNKESV